MKKLAIVLLVLVGLGAGGIFYFVNSEAGAGMQVGTNYVAKTMCSCVLVQGRDNDACYADMLVPDAANIPVTINPETGVVKASIFGVITGTAIYQEGRGCTLH